MGHGPSRKFVGVVDGLELEELFPQIAGVDVERCWWVLALCYGRGIWYGGGTAGRTIRNCFGEQSVVVRDVGQYWAGRIGLGILCAL